MSISCGTFAQFKRKTISLEKIRQISRTCRALGVISSVANIFVTDAHQHLQQSDGGYRCWISTPAMLQASTDDVASDWFGLSPTPRRLGLFSANSLLSFIHVLCFSAVV